MCNFVKIYRNQLYTKTWFMLFDCDNNIVLLYAISLFWDHQNKKKMRYFIYFLLFAKKFNIFCFIKTKNMKCQ